MYSTCLQSNHHIPTVCCLPLNINETKPGAPPPGDHWVLWDTHLPCYSILRVTQTQCVCMCLYVTLSNSTQYESEVQLTPIMDLVCVSHMNVCVLSLCHIWGADSWRPVQQCGLLKYTRHIQKKFAFHTIIVLCEDSWLDLKENKSMFTVLSASDKDLHKCFVMSVAPEFLREKKAGNLCSKQNATASGHFA